MKYAIANSTKTNQLVINCVGKYFYILIIFLIKLTRTTQGQKIRVYASLCVREIKHLTYF